MVKPQWRDRLRAELRKRGLPPAYAARLIEELSDHVTDLKQENPSMDAQMLVEEKLGTPESLAEAAAAELAGRTFAGRHPVLTFVVAPIPAAMMTLFAVLVVCMACKSFFMSFKPVDPDPLAAYEWTQGSLRITRTPPQVNPNQPTAFEWTVAYGIVFLQRFTPFGLTAWLFLVMARRIGRPVWGIAACALVALFAFTFRTGVVPPTFKQTLIIWFGFAIGREQMQIALLQSAVPLILGLWAWRQMARQPWPADAPSGS